MLRLFYLVLSSIILNFSFADDLTDSTEINITKSWSQEPSGWIYPIDISVPEVDVTEYGLPVCILLHGSGGNGYDMLLEWSTFLTDHILIAPSGYLNTWNIANEPSEAPDVEMVDDLINQLQTYDNVNSDKIRILGHSNGSALANRIFIENTNPGVDIICSISSQLSDIQYHNDNFYYPSGETGGENNDFAGYDMVTIPITGRKYLSITNTNDPIIPYYGGWAFGIYYINSLDAIHIVATSQGYEGSQLSEEEGVEIESSSVFEYSYLSNQVVHLKGIAEHYIDDTQRQYIINFFESSESELSNDGEIIPTNFYLEEPYPNPFNPVTSLRYDLPEQAQVTLTVYDLMGREVTRLVNTTQKAGYRSVQWNATDSFGKAVSAGVYLYQIQAGEFVQTKKMVLLK